MTARCDRLANGTREYAQQMGRAAFYLWFFGVCDAGGCACAGRGSGVCLTFEDEKGGIRNITSKIQLVGLMIPRCGCGVEIRQILSCKLVGYHVLHMTYLNF